MASPPGPKPGAPGRTARLAAGLAVFIWPLAYYYRFLIPDQGFSLRLLNDFRMLYYTYKVYLLDHLAQGCFPLWSPSEAAGFPFYSSPFTQAFYPLNLPLAGFYKLMGGYSYFDHQAYTVLGVSLFGLGLFLWLSRIIKNPRAVLFAALAVSISFKLGEALRMTNAVHTAAWLPWALYGLTLAAQRRRPRRAWAVIFISCLMILTGGYTYYVYYAVFLLPPYALLLLSSKARRSLGLEGAPFRAGPYLLTAGSSALAALALAAPYLYKTVQLMGQTVDRAGAGFKFATAHSLTPLDTLGSLIYPPAAQSEGWYYFGAACLFLLVMHAASSLAGRRGGGPDRAAWACALIFWAFVSLITYGKHTPLFRLFFDWAPGFDRLRVWGRLDIILLPVLALMLARAYAWFEGLLFNPAEGDGRTARKRALTTLGVAAALVLAAQGWLQSSGIHDLYWDRYFQAHHGREVFFIWAAAASALALAGMLLLAGRGPLAGRWGPALVLAALLILTTADLRPVGADQWAEPARPGLGRRLEVKTGRLLALSLTTPRVHLYDTINLNPRFNAGYIKNWYFARYTSFHGRVFEPNAPSRVKDQAELPWFRQLMGMDSGERFFFSRSLDHASIRGFMLDARRTRKELGASGRVEYYDGDRLLLSVSSQGPAYLSFIDNWDPDWRAFIDGRPARLERLFGTFKSLRLAPGDHRVLMEYRPFG